MRFGFYRSIPILSAAAAAALTLLPIASAADQEPRKTLQNTRVIVPERPYARQCFELDLPGYQAAIHLEEIEGEAIDGFGYADVSTAEGDSRGYLIAILGHIDRAHLEVDIDYFDSETATTERRQWAFVNDGLISDRGTFQSTDCLPVDEEYMRRTAPTNIEANQPPRAVQMPHLTTGGHTVEHVSDLRIMAPAAPLQHSCYRIETETHRGAISLDEIEGEAIDGYAFGNVFAQTGENWGYLSGILGQLDGAFLTVEVQSTVEGAHIVENEQWAFIEGGIVTTAGTYFDAECDPIDAEYIEWVTN